MCGPVGSSWYHGSVCSLLISAIDFFRNVCWVCHRPRGRELGAEHGLQQQPTTNHQPRTNRRPLFSSQPHIHEGRMDCLKSHQIMF